MHLIVNVLIGLMTARHRIFLSYSREDKPQVRDLYERLKERGFDPWLDDVDLIAGQVWKEEIRKAIAEASIFLACLSQQSVGKIGSMQDELRLALAAFAERPPGSTYLIPVRFDDCDVPDIRIPELQLGFTDLHWVNLFEENGLDRLVQSIEKALNKERKTYSVSIIRSQDVQIHKVLVNANSKKTTVDVQHPEGVEVKHVETKPRKTISEASLPEEFGAPGNKPDNMSDDSGGSAEDFSSMPDAQEVSSGSAPTDEKKVYHVNIVRSQDVQIQETHVDKALKKPTVIIQHPTGVELSSLETKSRTAGPQEAVSEETLLQRDDATTGHGFWFQIENSWLKAVSASGLLNSVRFKSLLVACSAVLSAIAILALITSVIWQLTRTTSDTEILADVVWRDGVAWRARLSDRGEVELNVEQPVPEDAPALPRRIMADIKGHASAIASVRFEQGGRVLKTIDQDGRIIETDIDALMRVMSMPPYRALQAAKQVAEVEIGRPYGERVITGAQDASNWALAVLSTGASPVRQPREIFRDCGDCPELVVIPAGSFLMGSPEEEGGRIASEGPQHEVTISASFALGTHEVTFAEWDACVSAGVCGHVPEDEGWGRGDRPVINVSFEDAQIYIVWLSTVTGEVYRLPSEAEWEYAARAGTTTRYFWGDEIGENLANCDGCGSEWDNRQTAPVGSFAANDPFGLFDMHGNVWEWVEDSWHDDYEGAPPDGSAWIEGKDSFRVLRGGSWFNFPAYLRSAFRDWFNPDFRNDTVGFRVSRTLTP